MNVQNGKKIYETTAKGKLYIENYRKMSDFLRPQEADETKIMIRWICMEMQDQKGYNIFTALHETIHNKSLRKLQFAKCQECGRLNPFRLISVEKETIICKKCGNLITVRTKK